MPDQRGVWIAQCLCGPAGHAIAATAGEAENHEAAERLLVPVLYDALDAREVNPWCGMCGAAREEWLHEVVRTKYATMKEAIPELTRIAAANRVAAALFGSRGSIKPGRA